MKTAIYLMATSVLLCLALAVGLYRYQEPPFKPIPAEFAVKIKETKDIEHLRSMSLFMYRAYISANASNTALYRAGIETAVWILIAFGALACLSLLALSKALFEQRGVRVPWWLRWL